MSDVEKYYKAICDKMVAEGETSPPEWNKLGIEKQLRVVHSINLMLQVIYD
jgi:hypothetical protein